MLLCWACNGGFCKLIVCVCCDVEVAFFCYSPTLAFSSFFCCRGGEKTTTLSTKAAAKRAFFLRNSKTKTTRRQLNSVSYLFFCRLLLIAVARICVWLSPCGSFASYRVVVAAYLTAKVIEEMMKLNPMFRPPADFVKSKPHRKLYIPTDEYPGYNFIGERECSWPKNKNENEETRIFHCDIGRGLLLSRVSRRLGPKETS